MSENQENQSESSGVQDNRRKPVVHVPIAKTSSYWQSVCGWTERNSTTLYSLLGGVVVIASAAYLYNKYGNEPSSQSLVIGNSQ